LLLVLLVFFSSRADTLLLSELKGSFLVALDSLTLVLSSPENSRALLSSQPTLLNSSFAHSNSSRVKLLQLSLLGDHTDQVYENLYRHLQLFSEFSDTSLHSGFHFWRKSNLDTNFWRWAGVHIMNFQFAHFRSMYQLTILPRWGNTATIWTRSHKVGARPIIGITLESVLVFSVSRLDSISRGPLSRSILVILVVC